MLLLPIASLAVLATHGERHEEHPPVGGFRCDLPVESSVGFKPETFEEKYRGKQVSQSAPLPACTVRIRAHAPVFPGAGIHPPRLHKNVACLREVVA